MKKLFYLLLIITTAVLFTSCDTTDDPITPTPTGNLFVSSNPASAQIWIDGVNTGKITPDTVKNLDEGLYSVTLKLTDFRDSTFSISVSGNQTAVVSNINLVSNVIVQSFGPVRIWETVGTTSSQPSGLDLSTGLAYGVSSADKDKVDIYYSTTGFLVQSANLNTTQGLTRVTAFRVGSSGNLNDGVDSPTRASGTWGNSMGDRETNYVFLYDHDSNYSKVKISSFGGGTPGNPAWVELTWIYNKTASDVRF